MSEEEDNVIKTQPTSPFESEPVDKAVYERMLHTFQSMGLNPKGNNPAELGQWMKDYIAQTKDIPPGASKVDQTGVRQDVKPKIPPLSLPSEGSSISRTRSVTTLSPYPPKIRTFSGGDNKGDTTYDIWRYEVRMVLKDSGYTREQKDFAIRRSLTGSAARIVMYQGPDKPLSDILETLDSVYGSVENKQQLLSEFYGARQREDEDITAWSGRLEEIIGKGLEKGIVRQNEVNSMLHSMLWTGLRQELKDISGYKYDNIQDFNKLRIALRQIEKDHQQDQQKTSKSNTATSICKSTNSKAENSDLEELKGMVQQLVSSVQQQNAPQQYRGNQHYRGTQYRGTYNGQQQRKSNTYQTSADNNQFQQQQRGPTADRNRGEIICRRCRQPGHIAIGCRVRLDHSRRNLNSRKPIQRGRY